MSMKLEERCRCGANFFVEGVADLSLALDMLEKWRTVHPCADPRDDRSGATSGSIERRQEYDFDQGPSIGFGHGGMKR